MGLLNCSSFSFNSKLLISKLELLKLRYRLSPNKVAQILRNHPDIHRKQDFKNSNRIAVYTWKPSNVETNSL